jgi:hypothetical protein
LGLYEKARALRPYNVYPKVKIEDLNALLAKQAAAAPEEDTDAPPVEPVATKSTGTELAVPTAPFPAPAPTAIQVPPPTETSVTPKIEEKPTITPPREEPTPLKKAKGDIERRYKEGNAFVIERTVTVDGHLVVYKRVYHSYGQVFYFENGRAVDERVWKARFPE